MVYNTLQEVVHCPIHYDVMCVEVHHGLDNSRWRITYGGRSFFAKFRLSFLEDALENHLLVVDSCQKLYGCLVDYTQRHIC